VAVAWDFRKRLLFGGPFARDDARIRRDHPTDDGSELVADPDIEAAVGALFDARARIEALEQTEKALKVAITGRMGEASTLRGNGWHATWKRTKDREEIDWKNLAAGLLRQLAEPERTALVGIHSSVKDGFRPFRLVSDKE